MDLRTETTQSTQKHAQILQISGQLPRFRDVSHVQKNVKQNSPTSKLNTPGMRKQTHGKPALLREIQLFSPKKTTKHPNTETEKIPLDPHNLLQKNTHTHMEAIWR